MLKNLFKKLLRRVRPQSSCSHDKVLVDSYGFDRVGKRVLRLYCKRCTYSSPITRDEVIKNYGFDPLKVDSND